MSTYNYRTVPCLVATPRVLLSVLVLVILTASHGRAKEADPVDGARRSLTKNRMPWYDSAKDDVRLVRVPTNNSDAHNRDSEWTGKRKKRDYRPRTGGGPGVAFWQAMQVIFWALLGALLAFVVALIVWAFVKHEGHADRQAVPVPQDDAARVENLPFQVRKPKADLLAEARRHYEAGNFAEAIIYLYSYQLVELDKSHVIQLTKGKTNRQYLRETRKRSVLSSILEKTMLAFEDVFFGHHELGRERFESCWQRLDEFHHDVQQVATT